MSCPTCDHTMQNLWLALSRNVFWCPRCGTLKDYQDPQRETPDISTPQWAMEWVEARRRDQEEAQLQDGIRSKEQGWG